MPSPNNDVLKDNSNRAYYELMADYLQSESKNAGSLKRPRRQRKASPAQQTTSNIKLEQRKDPKKHMVRKSQHPSRASVSKVVELTKKQTHNSIPRDAQTPNRIPPKQQFPTTPGSEVYDVDHDDGDSDGDEDSDEEFDDDDFEDVEIVSSSKPMTSNNAYNQNDSISVTIKARKVSRKPKSHVISKEHRLQRREVHMMHLVCMLVYGRQRNNWLNNSQLKLQYSSVVPKNIYSELHPSIKNREWSNGVKSRYFLDGLRHLMEIWVKRFRISSPTGIFKLNWGEIETVDEKFREQMKKLREKGMNKKMYLYNLSNFTGNRDIGGQGFVALLRSVQVKARLVFSIQPPDFTIASLVKTEDNSSDDSDDDSDDELENSQTKKKKKTKKLKSPLGVKLARSRIPKFQSNSKSLLQKIIDTHNKKLDVNPTSNFYLEKIMKQNPNLSAYPVFWAEAWNPYSKKWITIDPINFRIIEDIQKVSKLEPPMSDDRNNLLYAIAFDRTGSMKDVTRRYAKYFNSKTRKKRITRDSKGKEWYDKVFDRMMIKHEKSEVDILEDDYFTQRNIKEGMPNNIGDFRNHPVYVLESQLKSNEILYPKEPCGYVCQKSNGRNTMSIPVYHRQHVQELRSARGWFHQGRMVKMGERSLRVKRKKKKNVRQAFNFKKKDDEEENNDEEDNEDNTVRLYAEFQTELYKPDPIKNGVVPKNAYGNIDVYTDSMVPEGGVLITSKFAIQSSKLLGIDYSPAVIGFSFSYRNSTKPKVGGVVVAKEYEEAVNLVSEHLKDEDIERQRKQTASKSIKAWKLVFAKLRIVERLDRIHGEVPEENVDLSDDADENFEESIDYAKENDNDNDDDNNNAAIDTDIYGGGGFLPTDMDQNILREDDLRKRREQKRAKFNNDNNEHGNEEEEDFGDEFFPEDNGSANEEEEDFEGGFFPENDEIENEGKKQVEGGFFLEDNNARDVHQEDFGGGFFPEDSNENSYGGGGFLEPQEPSKSPVDGGGGFFLDDNNESGGQKIHDDADVVDEDLDKQFEDFQKQMEDEDFVYNPDDEDTSSPSGGKQKVGSYEQIDLDEEIAVDDTQEPSNHESYEDSGSGMNNDILQDSISYSKGVTEYQPEDEVIDLTMPNIGRTSERAINVEDFESKGQKYETAIDDEGFEYTERKNETEVNDIESENSQENNIESENSLTEQLVDEISTSGSGIPNQDQAMENNREEEEEEEEYDFEYSDSE